jgi:hypothetical protein
MVNIQLSVVAMKRNHGMVNHLAAIMLTGLKGRSKLKREI